METKGSGSEGGVPVFLWIVLAIVVLVFLPLGIAAGEEFLFGSGHFEDLLRHFGLHSTLGRIYRPVIDFFK